ncbi:MAG: hypothetical protein WD509_03345 [Candidatus Paceibacterota bacterium]
MTTDILIIFAVFVGLVFFSIWYGKSSSVSLLISIYLGILTFLSFPYLEEVIFLKSSESQVTLSQIGVFVVGVAVIYFIIRNIIFTEYSYGIITKYLQVILLSGASTALLFAFAYHTIPLTTLYDFNTSIDNLFSSQYFFYWLVAPILVLFVTTRE